MSCQGPRFIVLTHDDPVHSSDLQLLGGMDPTMRGLVSDRVLQLDNSIHPGLDKVPKCNLMLSAHINCFFLIISEELHEKWAKK